MPKEPTPIKSHKGHASFTTSASPFAREVSAYTCDLSSKLGLGALIQAMLAEGDAIIIGTTRDGGAVCITICEGDQRHKTYVHSQTELDRTVDWLMDRYQVGQDGTAS